ncbi:unnamed protein product [Didymodactylos carnosus]|uniref:M-phase inducer phosphatase n=1 Tax=Didymodactylos carnosus TaxID=1234261 RepID=A0A813ZMK3_9BILA|nr:unnamed protein product [Didymodactylos carnosus]CAF0920276.1 unnamed protein product [Didymodactylos carnosus]CAF3684770.1 unnamed protein product [Didymodactylos carnosus]CAF3697791.1 unnamed protein product [Didymodactylos carnosus]
MTLNHDNILSIEHWLNTSTVLSNIDSNFNTCFMMWRRTPRRKLFSSSEEEDDSPIKDKCRVLKENNLVLTSSISVGDTDEQLNTSECVIRRSTIFTTNSTLLMQQTKLEQFGFETRTRPQIRHQKQSQRGRKRHSEQSVKQDVRVDPFVMSKGQKIKKIDPESHDDDNINLKQQQIRNGTTHPMQTRSQSASDSNSDHLVRLFDKKLITVTPLKDEMFIATGSTSCGEISSSDECEMEEFSTTNVNSTRQLRTRPLPLLLSTSSDTEQISAVMTTKNRTPMLNIKNSIYNNNNKSNNKRSSTEIDEVKKNGKRRKVVHKEQDENKENIKKQTTNIRSKLYRSISEPFEQFDEARLKASVELGANRELIGDRTRPYLLPRCQSCKHNDLACIAPKTLIDVLLNRYSSDIEQFHIIDCRYPYEYDGGHINSSRNLYTREQIQREYFDQPMQLKDKTKRIIIIFHCEFSSERAPSLLRYLREIDRNRHLSAYPELCYPEIYLLEGGYKAFFEYSNEHCLPQTYRPMLETGFTDQLQHYRFKTRQLKKTKSSSFDVSTTSQRTSTKYYSLRNIDVHL